MDVLHQHRLVLELVTLGLVVKLVVQVLVDLLRLWRGGGGGQVAVHENQKAILNTACNI